MTRTTIAYISSLLVNADESSEFRHRFEIYFLLAYFIISVYGLLRLSQLSKSDDLHERGLQLLVLLS